jgi:hypothetical protein
MNAKIIKLPLHKLPKKVRTRISILVPCEIGETQKLMDALDHVRNKIRVSKTIRGYADSGFAWTVGAADSTNDTSSPTAGGGECGRN